MGSWAAYESWNLAVEAVFFDGRNAGRPVYLDVEDEILKEAHALTGLSGDALESLDAAVRDTLALASPGPAVFQATPARRIMLTSQDRPCALFVKRATAEFLPLPA